jgi:hypothetical protein
MRKLLLLSALFCVGAFAQTTITVTVTVPAAAGPVANAWLLANCPSPLVSGACPVTVQAYLKSVVAQAVQQQMQTILNWAISTNDASLPNAVKVAITNQQTAQTALAVAQASAQATVQ